MKRKLLSCFIGFFLCLAISAKAQQASISASATSGCAPLPITFVDQSTDATSWSWNFGGAGASPATSTQASELVLFTQAGTYTITLTDNSSGTKTAQIQITVLAAPIVNFSADKTSGCFPLNVQFTSVVDAGPNATAKAYNWDFGDGSVIDINANPQHTYVNAANFPISLQVFSSNGCKTTVTKSAYINVNGGIDPDFDFSVAPVCKPPAVTSFTNKTAGPGSLTYTWIYGDGGTASGTNPPHTYNAAGNYNVKLIAKSSVGCIDSATKNVLVTSTTVQSKIIAPDSVCTNSPVTYVNSTVPSPFSANWDFGNGGTSTQIVPPPVFYYTPGTVTVTVNNNFGACTDQATKKVHVFLPPTPDFTASNTNGCKAPFTVNFQDKSTSALSWYWDFGDGTTSTQQNPVHTYTTYGAFTVTLTATSATSCTNTVTKANFIKVMQPMVKVLPFPSYGCSPYTFTPKAKDSTVDGVASYNWNFGNGTTFSGQNPPALTYTTGQYNLVLTITTTGGCTAKFIDTVKVGLQKPNAAFNSNTLSTCVGTTVQFTDQSTGNPNEWNWNFGDTAQPIARKNVSHVYTEPGTYTVSLLAYNNGCSSLATKTIVVNPPLANFGFTYTCANKQQYNFTDKTGSATNWKWDFGDGSPVSALQNPTHTFPSDGKVYTVTLTATNSTYGCTNSLAKAISVSAKPVIVGPSFVCHRDNVFIKTENTGDVASWTFDFGDGTTLGPLPGSGANHLYSNTGSYQIKITTVDTVGCTNVLTQPFRVNGPTADFSINATQGCTSLPVKFTDHSTTDGVNQIQAWYWDFGDGTSSTAQNPVHTYTTQGLFSIKLRITDASGCMDSIIKLNQVTVSVIKPLFSAGDSLFCPKSQIDFQNITTGGFQPVYNWTFGDGSSFNGQTPPTHNYPNVGQYPVTLSVTDALGCSASYTSNITIDVPTASFTIDKDFATCPPLDVHFTFTGRYYRTIQWLFDDGGANIDTLNPGHVYTLPNDYYPTLIVTSPGGCTARDNSKHITVQGPIGKLFYSPLAGCNSLLVNFSVATSNVVKFIWNFGDAIDSTTVPFISHKYTSPKKYQPFVILGDAENCRVAYKGDFPIVIDSIHADFDVDRAVYCANGSVQFIDSSFAVDTIATYVWDFGDGASDNSNNPHPSHFYANPGLYTTKLTVTSKNGCTDNAVRTNQIKIVANPVIDFAAPVSQCVPAPIAYAGIEVVPDTSVLKWKWDFGNGHQSGVQNPPAELYDVAGHYFPQLIAINSTGCTDTVGTGKDFFVYPKPLVNAGFDTTICVGTSAQLQATGAVGYSWLAPGSGTLSCSNCDNPVATPPFTATYVVQGTSNFGCIANDTVMVTVNQPVKISVSPDDSVCIGSSVPISASGAALYAWSPAAGLNNSAISNPSASPGATTTYRVVGSDNKYCFNDTGYVKITVFPYPTIDLGPDFILPVGFSQQINANGSPDITSLQWTPATALSCTDCFTPIANPLKTITYIATATNNGGCSSSDSITVTVVCNNGNFFVPNTFSPNGDGMNDVFYVRGKGINVIASIAVFNRWGQMVFERRNFAPNDPSAGWDGTINGKPAPADAYVYTVELICDNQSIIPYHGSITLIR